MHIFDKSVGFVGGHGIVGAQIPLGAGLAFAEKYKKTGNLSICYFGDGAVRQGALHETFNMAMLWKLPVIFVVENNGYAMGTSVARTSNVTDLYTIGEAYDMPSEPVDAMDVEAVHEAVSRAAARARAGEGPTFLEFRTYRYRGHSMSDPQKMAAAVETYLASFAKRDHNAVADLFAEQCTVEDPIGTDIHKGREAVREFYKMAMANGAKLTLEGQIRIVRCGNIAHSYSSFRH